MVSCRLIAPCALLALAGCASLTTADGQRLRLTSPEFRAYVERVFRAQNQVGDELAFALDAPGDERVELGLAEQRLLDACAGVNELATARRDERGLGARRSLSAARTVPRCERTTSEIAALLSAQVEP